MRQLVLALCSLFIFINSYAQLPYDTLTIGPVGIPTVALRSKNSICTDTNGKIWIGLSQAGILHYNGTNWSLIDSLSTNGQLPSKLIRALHYNPNHGVLVGSTAGLTIIQNNSYTNYPFGSPNFPNAMIYDIKANTQSVFVATSLGLRILDLNTGSWSGLNTGNSSIPSDLVVSLKFDQSGSLWMATQGGYAQFNGVSVLPYTSSNTDLPGNNITDIAVTDHDTLLSVQGFGLYRRLNNQHILLDSLYNTSYGASFCDSNSYVGISYDPTPVAKTSRFLIDDHQNIVFVYQRQSTTGVPSLCYMDTLKRLWELSFQNNTIPSNLPPVLISDYYNDSLVLVVNAAGGSGSISNITTYFIPMPVHSGYVLVPTRQSGVTGPLIFDVYIPPSMKAVPGLAALEGNMVRAAMLNRGDLHWDPVGQVPLYEAPRGSGRNSVFASSIWLGGYDQSNQLYCAAQTYRQGGSNDFWPGPLDVNGQTTNAVKADFDYIWLARKSDIEEFRYQFAAGNVQNGTYPIPAFILDWPANYNVSGFPQKLAPFVDVNNNTVYDPINGDYPDIKGDQMAWCVFNDFGLKTETNSPVMNLEVQMSAYSFNCFGSGNLPLALSYTTFYHYDVYNRGSSVFDSCYFGIWSDLDIGNAVDDYLGCDLSTNSFFGYNGDPDDDGGGGYGQCPPTQNVSILKAPEAPLNDGIDNNHDGVTDEPGEEYGMSGFLYYENTSGIPNGNPLVTDDYYEYLNTHWLDGAPVTYGGNGRGVGTGSTNTPTRFMFPGTSNPAFPTNWTMATAGLQPTDMRGLASVGPFDLPPGAKKSFDLAFFTGPNDRTLNQSLLIDLRNFFRSNPASSFSSIGPTIQGPTAVSILGILAFYTITPPVGSNNTYQWSVSNGTIISGQGTTSVIVLWNSFGTGEIAVQINQSGSLCALKSRLPVSVGFSGLAENDHAIEIRPFPNPTTGLVHLEDQSEFKSYRIYNDVGQLVQTSLFSKTIDISKLSTGVFMLEIMDDESKVIARSRLSKL